MKITPSQQEELQFHSKLFLSIPDPIVATDEFLNITCYNTYAEEIFIWKPEEVIGKPVRKVVASIYPGSTPEEVADVLFEKGVWKGEIVTHRKNGESFPAYISVCTINDALGKVTGTIAVIRDISSQKKQEEEIKSLALDLKKANQQLEKKVLEKTEELSGIFETITDGVAAFDKDWNYTYVNKKGADGVGSSPELLTGKNVWQMFPQLVGSSIHTNYLKAAREQKVNRVLEYIEPFDKWFEGVMYPSPDGLVAYFQDVTDRKNAEIARDKSQELYRTIVETAQEGILQTDENNIITFVNDYIPAKFGYSAEDLCGKSVLDVVGKHNVDAALQNIAGRKKGETHQYEFTIFDSVGHPIDTLIQSRPLFKAGEFAGSISTILDITARKKGEAKLLESEKRFKSLFEYSNDGIALLSAQGIILDVSPSIEKILGLKREQLVGTSRLDFVSPEDVGLIHTAFRAVMTDPAKVETIEYRAILADGSGKWVECTFSNLVSEPAVNAVVLNFRDITGRKNNQQLVLESEKKYRQIVETAQEGIWILNEQGITTFVNQKLSDMLEYSAEEILGKTSLFFTKYDDREAFLERVEIRKKGQSETHETVFYSKSRKEIYTKISTNPFFDNAGKYLGSLAMVTDITDLKRAEEEKEFERRNKEALINGTEDLIWSVTSNYKLIAANGAFLESIAKYTGFKLRQGDDLLMEERYSSAYLTFWKTLYDRALAGEQFTEEINTNTRNAESHEWLEVTLHPIRKGDVVEGIVCFSRDITERKIAVEKIKESEAHLAEAQRLFDMGSWNFDVLSDQLTWSDHLYKVFDTDRETFDGTHTQFLQMIVEEDRELALQTSLHTQQTGAPFTVTYRIHTASGKTRTIQEQGYGVKDNNGKILRLFGTAQNITARVQAEEANRFQAQLLNAIGQAAVATDANGIISFWNKTAEVMYGWLATEVIGKKMVDVIPSEQTRKQSLEIMEQLYEGKTWEGEFIAQRKDGSTFPVFINDVPIYDQQHNFKGVIGVSVDITERKKAEHLLHTSEARYRKAQMLGKLGHWELDLDSNKLLWSDETYRIFGVDEKFDSLDYDTFLSFIHPEDKEMVQREMDHALAGLVNYSIFHRIVSKDGSIRYVHEVAELVKGKDGMPVKFAGMVQDVTEQKILEKDLRISETNYKLLFEQNPVPLWMVSLETSKFLEVNEAAVFLYGYTAEEFLEMNIFNIRHQEDDNIMEVLKREYNNLPLENIVKHRKKNGDVIFAKVTIQRIAYKEKQVLLSAIRDVTDELNYQKALKKREQQLTLIFDNTLNLMWLLKVEDNNEYRIEAANEALANVTGIAKDQMIGQLVRDIFDVDLISTLIDKAGEAVKTGIEQKYISLSKVKEGEKLLEINIIPIKGEQQQVIQLLGVAADITEQKKAEQQIVNTERQLKTIYNTVSDIIFMLSIEDEDNYRFVSVNQMFLTTTGLLEEQVIGRSILDVIPRSSHNLVISKYREAIYNGKKVTWEEQSEYPTGLKTAFVTIAPVLDEDGKPILLVGSISDITEQKQAEQKLTQSEEKYRLLFEKSPQPMWIFDTETLRFLGVNAAAVEQYGYSRGEFLEMTLKDVRPEADNAELLELSDVGYRRSFVGTSLHKKKGGELIKVQVSVSAIEYENKKARLALLIDRTEQEKARKDLLQLNVQLRQLAARLQDIREDERTNMAREIHDELGQQLTGLKMDIAWLNRKFAGEDENIRAKIKSSLQLIDGTINTVRKIASDLRPAILDDLGLSDAIDWHTREFSKRTSIPVAFTSEVPDVKFAPPISIALFRVFQEALTNVARHANATAVTSSLKKTKQGLLLVISDNGTGFSEHQQTERKTLGLLGMRERVEMLEGTYHFNSKAGKGTTISVLIPLP